MKSAPRHIQLHVLVDGLGWEVVRDLEEFSFLSGERRPLETVLGYSSGAIPTLLTGKMPEEHGVWNLFIKDEANTDFPLFKGHAHLPKVLSRSRVLRKILLLANKALTRFPGYYQAYEFPSHSLSRIRISERRNLYATEGVPGTESVFDAWERQERSWGVLSYRDGLQQDDALLAVAQQRILEQTPEVFFLYLSGYDAWGHSHANDPDLMRTEAARVAGKLKGLLETLRGRYESVDMDVFSDHGMVPLRGTCDVRFRLETVASQFPTQPWFCVLDSTMARFYWNHPDAEQTARHALQGLPGRFLDERDLERWRVRFNGVYGDAIWLSEPGIQIVPSDMSSRSLPGMHGFDPDDADMKASYQSTRNIPQKPNGIWDLFALMTLRP